MAKFTFDEKEYDTEELSTTGRLSLHHYNFRSSNEKLKAEIAVYQTARNAYSNALQEELD